jgi:putative transposase
MNDWPHAPIHRFGDGGFYFITAGTLYKQHFFRSAASLEQLCETLFTQALSFACWLQAWAVFSNHYHLVVKCEDGENVRQMLSALHTKSALDVNKRDGVHSRKIWYQFWDLHLTIQASWLARLKYTHENAVHHGLVARAENYPWCSAAWFANRAPRGFVETVGRMKIDRVNVDDDFPAAVGAE